MRRFALPLIVLIAALPAYGQYRIVSWNELGMHCMDGDFSVFSILPPYNTIHAQVIGPDGRLVRSLGNLTLTYEAVADEAGSINTTSSGKTNFWDHAGTLFGASLSVDQGLAGFDMPGPDNTPQPMSFDSTGARFSAVGIPITPIDDDGFISVYPRLKLVLRDGGTVLATAVIALPVSSEIDCARCHASGSNAAARPASGWAEDPDPERDTRMNIIRLHDGATFMRKSFPLLLEKAGIPFENLESAVLAGSPILCAACHASNALGTTGLTGVPSLTSAMHASHATVTTGRGVTIDDMTTREGCYLCHPGADTRCLRDAMGSAGSSDGRYEIECQACHGNMTSVGSSTRDGWLDEPQCGACHTGTETLNSGSIRYTSVFDSPGHERNPASKVFSVDTGNLYRESTGHGGLFCPACHGAPHAVVPSRETGDNLQSISAMGNPGVLAECTACHPSEPSTTTGGPHGLHPIGQAWVRGHEGPAENGPSACQACHATSMRGGPLSAVLRSRNVSTEFGSKSWWRGTQVGCYSCHNGPSSEGNSQNALPIVTGTALHTSNDAAVAGIISASDPDGAQVTLRVVDKPLHGSAGFTGRIVTYTPDPGFVGSDSFTIAARDGTADSNLATVQVEVVHSQRRRPARP